MILVPWSLDQGWDAPTLVPYGPLSLSPSSSVVNYASSCFEGLKVYKGYDGRLRLLQPEYNCRRLLNSAARIQLPSFDTDELLKLVKRLCVAEAPRWLPDEMAGSSLYVRPVLMGTEMTLGFRAPRSALLCIFLVYWPGVKLASSPNSEEKTAATTEKGSRLLASSEGEIRAFPKGNGAAKIGANYAPTLFQHARALERGYDQVLWLFGPERLITEAGGSNIFIIWTTASGQLQIVTPPLDDDRLILAGSNRAFVLGLARDMFSAEAGDGVKKCDVVERKVSMLEVEEVATQGRLEGMFVTGTAWQIHPVGLIRFNERDIDIPVGRVPYVSLLKEKMLAIFYGKEESEWVQVVDES